MQSLMIFSVTRIILLAVQNVTMKRRTMKLITTLKEPEGKRTRTVILELTESAIVVADPNEEFAVLIGNDGDNMVVNIVDNNDESVYIQEFGGNNGEDEAEQELHLSGCGTQ